MTDTIAATKFVNRNSIIINLYLEPIPDLALEMAEATKTKTKIGAMALRTSTNIIPGNPIMDNSGTIIPKIAPMITPIIILSYAKLL